MKRNLGILFLMFGICLVTDINAYATTITLSASPLLTDTLLDGSFGLWDVNFTAPVGQTIESVTLNIDDIYAISGKNNNYLNVYLDNSVSNPFNTYGLIGINHNSNGSSWAGFESYKIKNQLEGNLIDSFDVNKLTLSWSGFTTQNLSYTFDTAQIDALIADDASGSFAIGIDPDALFEDKGIDLVITTENNVSGPGGPTATPEPATFSLLGIGFMGLLGLRKKAS